MTGRSGPSRSRRAVLGAGAGALALLAGCIDDVSAPGRADDEDEPAHESYPYQHPDLPDSPEAALLIDADDADGWLEERSLDDRDADLEAFVEETSFEESVLVALEATGPNLCHELVLESVALEDETVAVDATVVDGTDEDQACAPQVTAVGLLVRVTVTDDPVGLTARIVDADGREHEIEAVADSATDD